MKHKRKCKSQKDSLSNERRPVNREEVGAACVWEGLYWHLLKVVSILFGHLGGRMKLNLAKAEKWFILQVIRKSGVELVSGTAGGEAQTMTSTSVSLSFGSEFLCVGPLTSRWLLLLVRWLQLFERLPLPSSQGIFKQQRTSLFLWFPQKFWNWVSNSSGGRVWVTCFIPFPIISSSMWHSDWPGLATCFTSKAKMGQPLTSTWTEKRMGTFPPKLKTTKGKPAEPRHKIA